MSDHMYALVPADLWELLDAADFPEVEITRSPDHAAQIVDVALSIWESHAPDAAALIGVLVGRDRLVEFVERLMFWTHQQPPPPLAPSADDRFTLDLVTHTASGENRFSVDCAVGPDGRPSLDRAALTAVVTSIIDGSTGPGSPGA
ncbi:hypothetical protein [Streptomyces hokutonensis]|uniref:Uncharacterized protein n=1 Tax=Streptomyces hokutonensis TaxID=1306990 RepID=A0ABW6LTG1_9ACTN